MTLHADTKLLTVQLASAYLSERTGMVDLTPKWVQGQIDHGILPCTIVNRRRRVRQDALDALIVRWMRDAA